MPTQSICRSSCQYVYAVSLLDIQPSGASLGALEKMSGEMRLNARFQHRSSRKSWLNGLIADSREQINSRLRLPDLFFSVGDTSQESFSACFAIFWFRATANTILFMALARNTAGCRLAAASVLLFSQ